MELYLTMKWLHLIAAGLVLGVLAVYPLLPGGLPRGEGERHALSHVLRFLNVTGNLVLVPAVVLLFVTGVAMSVGPFSQWNAFSRDGLWIVVGMALWVVVAGVVGGVLLGLVKEMTSVVDAGDIDRDRLDRLWRQFRWSLVAGLVVTAVTFWDMVFQPTFG